MRKIIILIFGVLTLIGCASKSTPPNNNKESNNFPIKEEILKKDSCEILNIDESELNSFQFKFGTINDQYCNVLITTQHIKNNVKSTNSFDLEYEKSDEKWFNIDMHPNYQYLEPTSTITKDIAYTIIKNYLDNHTDLGFNGTDEKNKYDEIIINNFTVSDEEKETNVEYGSAILNANIVCKYDTEMLKETAKYNISFKYENDDTWSCKELKTDGKATLNYNFDGRYKPYTDEDSNKIKGDITINGHLSRTGERIIKNNEIVDEIDDSFQADGIMTVTCTVFNLPFNSYRDVSYEYNLVDDGLWNFLSLEGSEGIANFNPKNELIFFSSEVSSLMPSIGIKKI